VEGKGSTIGIDSVAGLPWSSVDAKPAHAAGWFGMGSAVIEHLAEHPEDRENTGGHVCPLAFLETLVDNAQMILPKPISRLRGLRRPGPKTTPSPIDF